MTAMSSAPPVFTLTGALPCVPLLLIVEAQLELNIYCTVKKLMSHSLISELFSGNPARYTHV
ncbi:hypothetical protein QOT17_002818 [Balamuthia mandrillaris]